LISATILVVSGTLLQGCADGKFQTFTAAGENFPKAEYAVRGKTRYDQVWVDKTIEAEVAGFGFPRPKPRPASLDTQPAKHSVVVRPAPSKSTPMPLPSPTSQAPTVTVEPVKKPGLVKREYKKLRDWMKRHPGEKPPANSLQ
jgi:hypothetical protein